MARTKRPKEDKKNHRPNRRTRRQQSEDYSKLCDAILGPPKPKRSRRTKPAPVAKKSRRTKPVRRMKVRDPRYQNRGGFMIDPPEYCEWGGYSSDGAFWVDMALCHRCEEKCDRYLSYTKMTKEERLEDNLDRGIIPPTEWK